MWDDAHLARILAQYTPEQWAADVARALEQHAGWTEDHGDRTPTRKWLAGAIEALTSDDTADGIQQARDTAEDRIDDGDDPDTVEAWFAVDVLTTAIYADAAAHLDAQIEAETEAEDARREAAEATANNELLAAIRDGSDDDTIRDELRTADRRDRWQLSRALTRNAVVRWLLDQGATVDHISHRASLYVTLDDFRFRVSDHDLPQTAERQHNRARGLTGDWDYDVDTTRTPAEAIADIQQYLADESEPD